MTELLPHSEEPVEGHEGGEDADGSRDGGETLQNEALLWGEASTVVDGGVLEATADER